MTDHPTGTVTFLFTDIEGSTRLWEEHREAMQRAFTRQEQIIRDAVVRSNGYAYKMIGDAFQVAFATAPEALAAALYAQRALHAESWGEIGEIRVRMALHTGVTEERDHDYVGPVLNRAARVLSAGFGGQILLTQATADLVQDELSPSALRDLGEKRLRDLARAEHIYQVVVGDLPSDFPPLKTLDTFPHNLPAQVTSFVGREREIAETKRLLGAVRLLTLTGSGGAGKTRLSLQVAADVLESFPDGVWFVELAPLSDPALVPQEVATVLGLQEQVGRSWVDVLTEHFHGKHLLLVLDNCEHLIDACARLTDQLLHRCPDLKILASSREALGITGETSYRVPSLEIPNLATQLPIYDLIQFDAIKLFRDRAAALQPRFVMTDANALVVAQICYRLDGIPLAIELAAARVKVLSVDQIFQKLDDRFRLLTSGSRTALPRQQTLRAAMDWSYDLLLEPERVLLRRLSVFAGGWSLEAAEGVTCGDALVPADVLDLLTHLVDKSLVMVDEQRGMARYRMLQTIREYGEEKLFESGERDQLWKRHLEYFCEFTEQAEPGMSGAEQAEWVNRVELEHDNIRAGLGRSKSVEGDLELGLRLAGALFWFWEQRSYLQEGRASLAALLARSTDLHSRAHAKALTAAAQLTFRQGDYAEAKALCESSLKIFRDIGDKRWVAIVLNLLANIGTELGDYETTPAMFKEVVALGLEVDDKRLAVWGLVGLGYAELRPGGLEAAAGLFARALAVSREIGDKFSIAFELAALGEVAVRQGDYRRATDLLEESLDLRRQMDHKWGVGVCLGTLGWVAMRQEDWGKAKARLGESLEVRHAIGDKGGCAWSLERLAEVAEARGELERAVRILAAAAALRSSIDSAMDGADRPAYEQRVAGLREKLGEGIFSAVWSEGNAMTIAQAVAFALEKANA